MADSNVCFLHDHPNLQPFVLSSVDTTGTIVGSGSFGSVEEVKIPGLICVAKKFHSFLENIKSTKSDGGLAVAEEIFLKECKLMSTLRHPNIVQFMGVCFFPDSRLPAIVMERLATNLHDILDPETSPNTFIPLSLKCSILHDIASGLCFLHSQPEPIIHRDLTAKNILLTEGMSAKIADLGMSRIVPHLEPATMTRAPGAMFYMPPEALDDESRYDVKIDAFSFGVVAIFTLSQIYPKPLAAAYMDSSGKMQGRTELERRSICMAEITKQIPEDHPLMSVIQQCLQNRASERPSILDAMELLQCAKTHIGQDEYDANKLQLIQLLHTRRQSSDDQSKEINSLKVELGSKNAEIDSLQMQLKPLQVTDPKVDMKKWSLSLSWRKGKDIPSGCQLRWASAVVIGENVYCGGNDPFSNSILRYNIASGKWFELCHAPLRGFAMTLFKGQLVIVGGGDVKVAVWDSTYKAWIFPYPAMKSKITNPAVVGYDQYLVVACGFGHQQDVEIFDSTSGVWYSACQVPVGAKLMSSVVVGDRWYLSSFMLWEDDKKHVYSTHLPTLISDAKSGRVISPGEIWHELPKPPVVGPALLDLKGNLLLVGGWGCVHEIHRYDKDTERWVVCGLLPVGMEAPCCALLPSGDLMIAVGVSGHTNTYSKRMWLASILV